MGEVLNLPETHNYFMCPECDFSTWFILWPQDDGEAWYIECGGCGQQYAKGIITGDAPPD